MLDDAYAYRWCHERDRWLFNKLAVAEYMGYLCGPGGVPVPHDGEYVVRPIYNIRGMGAGAHFDFITEDNDVAVPPGYFWCERFPGYEVLSVDYNFYGQPIRARRGRLRNNDPQRFDRWTELHVSDLDLPPFPIPLHGQYSTVNAEFMGDKVVEVHLRSDPDPVGDFGVLWDGDDDVDQDKFLDAIEDADGYGPKRLGFYRG